MLEHIKEHSMMVARVAGFITKHMQEAGQVLSVDIAVAAALLHDIAKTASLTSNGNHAVEGRNICREHKFNEIADIVGEHVVLVNGVPSQCCSEKEIVYYADKRVLHDKVVSLDARLDYILERYGQDDERLCRLIEKNFLTCRKIEEKLFIGLDFEPDDLAGLVNGHSLTLAQFKF